MDLGEKGVGSTAAQLGVWSDVLDEFETTLDHAARQVAEGGDEFADVQPGAVFTPSSSMPPFPVELAERGRRLAARHDVVVRQLEAATSEMRDTILSSVASVHRNKTVHRSPSVPSFDAFA